MSNKLHSQASLPDMIGPLDGRAVDRLQTAYAAHVHNVDTLHYVAKRTGSVIDETPPTTSDGYPWYCAAVSADGVWIMFPHMKDDTLEDGTRSDRCVGLYVSQGPEPERAFAFATKFAEELNRVNRVAPTPATT